MTVKVNRQRPSWLPRWIPYRDGRFLGLARQTLLAWTSTLLSTLFFNLTIAFARQRSSISYLPFIQSSRSNTLLVLRVLSEAAGVFMASTIYATFEVVQWLKISRPDGISLPEFLAFQSSTGRLGLLVLALGRGIPLREWPLRPRVTSLLRLISEFAAPVLGVLIMSRVDVDPIYVPVPSTVTPANFGMQNFVPQVASQLGVMQDVLLNIKYASFLWDPLHAVVSTADTEGLVNGCIQGVSWSEEGSCVREVLLTQETQNSEANWTGLSGSPEFETIVAMDQQLLKLQFEDNVNMRYDERSICQRFTSGPSSYRICARNEEEDGSLYASLVACPPELVESVACAKDESWLSSKGWTTRLTTSFVRGTVAYKRPHGTIRDVSSLSSPAPTTIHAGDLIFAMSILLDPRPSLNTSGLTTSILGPPMHIFGRLIAGHMVRLQRLIDKNPEMRVRATNALQSLIAVTLYNCQPGSLSQTILPVAGNTTASSNPLAFSAQPANALLALARTRYHISVGRGTLIAYTILGGLTLVLCFIALLIGTMCELCRLDAEPTLYPSLDFWTQCKVQTDTGVLVNVKARADIGWMRGPQMFREISGLRVVRRKRVLGDKGEGFAC